MHRPVAILLLAILAPACSLMPAKSEYIRARQMEDAVLPMAATALESGQLETARRLYRRLLEIDPESVQARMGLGDVALRERETAAAARWYLAASTRAREPGRRHAALLAHGRTALAAGRLEAARESFTRLTDPEENAPRASVAWGHNGIGLSLLLEGDLHGAVAAMEQAVLRAPEEERFRGNLDRALALLGEFAAPDERSRALPDVDLPWVPPPDRTGAAQAGTAAPALSPADSATPGPPRPADPVAAVPRLESGVKEEAGSTGRADDLPAIGVEEHNEAARDTDVEAKTGLDEADNLAGQPDSVADTSPEPTETSAVQVQASLVGALDASLDSGSSAETAAAALREEAESEENRPAAPEVDTSKSSGTLPLPHRVYVVTENSLPHLQFGAYAKPANADNVADRLRSLTDRPVILSDTVDKAGASLHRVRIGPLPSGEALLELIALLETQGYRIANPPPRTADDIGNGPALSPRSLQALLVHEDGRRFLQAGAYGKRARAESLARELRGLTDRPVRITEAARANGAPLHRVRIGPLEPDDALIDLFGLAD